MSAQVERDPMREVIGMQADPRVTPTSDLAPDNPARGRLTVDRLGQELATELGLVLTGVAPGGVGQEAVGRYEAETHSRGRRRSR